MNQPRLAIRVVRSLALASAFVCVGMTSTVLAQNGDLSVSKSGNQIIFAGSTVEYLVSVSNVSSEASTPTNTLTDTFPAELTFVSVLAPDGWICTPPPVTGPNTITCTSETAIPVDLEGSQTFTFTFQVAAEVLLGTQVTNSASLVAYGFRKKWLK